MKLSKISKGLLIFALVFVLPALVFAQTTGQGPTRCSGIGTVSNIEGFICKLNELLGRLLPFLIALGIVYFVWGVISYVIGSDEEAKKKGRDRMIYGIIGLVVIIGVWGLVKLVTNTFGLDNVEQIEFPTVPY